MRSIPTLDSSDALLARVAGLAAATERDLVLCIAVVDAAGVLLDLHRSDRARSHTVDLAIRKARTSALLGLDTLILERMAKEGRSLPADLLALAGGVAIVQDGLSAGAVGVSGGASEVDHEVAATASKAITERTTTPP